MYPELFEVPFLHVTVKSYGTLMVIGFLLATLLMRRMMKKAGQNPEYITNAALYALIAGVVSSRIFYVLQNLSQFQENPLRVFAVWEGGLVFLGGVLGAIGFLLIYFHKQKLPMRVYFDVLAVGLMLGLAFGRLGCLMNGCCYGKPTDVPWSIRFPYGSLAYQSQAYPDPGRDRDKPQLELPAAYFGRFNRQGDWVTATEQSRHHSALKPRDILTEQQKQAVTDGPYRCLPVHPTQVYSSIKGFVLAAVFYGLWCAFGLRRPGVILPMVLTGYGVARFAIETLRDDTPFEYAWWMLYRGGTIAQNMSIYLILIGIVGWVCAVAFAPRRPSQKG